MIRNVLLVILLTSHVAIAQNYIDLTWSDEFDVNGQPNPENWGYDLGQSGWGNNEVQNYTNLSQNSRVENGVLIIDALKSNGNWTSARLKSQGKKSFTYGRIVFRAKLPTGIGTWPALWMLGESISTLGWPACGEIDIMEHVGKNPSIVQAALHTTSSNGNTVNRGETTVNTFNTAFHTYEAIWTSEKIQFLVDGIPYYTYQPATKTSATWPFTSPQFLIMNIAMGGNFGGPTIDPALTAARMEVDYVRVYQSFTELNLQGPTILEKNQQGIKFKTNKLEGAVYAWTLPPDATITSGEGTNEITVNWGTTEGSVETQVTVDNQVYEKSLTITHVAKPQGSTFSILKPEFGIEWTEADPVNEFVFTESETNEVRIKYSVPGPSANFGIVGKFFRTIDMSEYSVLNIRMKSLNKSGTLNARIDLQDIAGNTTNKAPVFNLIPLIDDGEYFTYSFDFETQNQWLSNQANVDATRIDKLKLYLNFGVFGVAGNDSIWIEDIWLKTLSTEASVPKRPSHLAAILENETARLTWRDNSTDESGFIILRALTPDGVFEAVAESPPNVTSIEFPYTNQTRYYYRVKSFNDVGNSDQSNAAEPQIVTSVPTYPDGETISVYPNPAGEYIYIKARQKNIRSIELFDMLGRRTNLVMKEMDAEPIHINISMIPSGNYLVRINANNQFYSQRLFIH